VEQAESKAVARAELLQKIREQKIARRDAKRAVLIARREARKAREFDSHGTGPTALAMNR
jgi:hypothetical protein